MQGAGAGAGLQVCGPGVSFQDGDVPYKVVNSLTLKQPRPVLGSESGRHSGNKLRERLRVQTPPPDQSVYCPLFSTGIVSSEE